MCAVNGGVFTCKHPGQGHNVTRAYGARPTMEDSACVASGGKIEAVEGGPPDEWCIVGSPRITLSVSIFTNRQQLDHKQRALNMVTKDPVRR